MVMKERLRFGSPAVKLGAFAVVLGLALAGGLVVGATVGPEPSTGDQASDHDAAHDDTDAVTTGDGPDGLAVSSHGYTLDLRTPVVEPAAGADLALVIEGPDGHRSPTTRSSTTRNCTSSLSAATSPATPTCTRHATATGCGP